MLHQKQHVEMSQRLTNDRFTLRPDGFVYREYNVATIPIYPKTGLIMWLCSSYWFYILTSADRSSFLIS